MSGGKYCNSSTLIQKFIIFVAYNCRTLQGKFVNPAEDGLPAGWSLDKNSYIEMFQRQSNKPLTQVVVIIPVVESEKQFAPFWRQICENAGAVIILADKAGMKIFYDENFVN